MMTNTFRTDSRTLSLIASKDQYLGHPIKCRTKIEDDKYIDVWVVNGANPIIIAPPVLGVGHHRPARCIRSVSGSMTPSPSPLFGEIRDLYDSKIPVQGMDPLTDAVLPVVWRAIRRGAIRYTNKSGKTGVVLDERRYGNRTTRTTPKRAAEMFAIFPDFGEMFNMAYLTASELVAKLGLDPTNPEHAPLIGGAAKRGLFVALRGGKRMHVREQKANKGKPNSYQMQHPADKPGIPLNVMSGIDRMIAEGIMAGQTQTEIAQNLNMSQKTVFNQIKGMAKYFKHNPLEQGVR